MDLERLARDTVARTLLDMLRGPHATPADAQTRTWYAQLR